MKKCCLLILLFHTLDSIMFIFLFSLVFLWTSFSFDFFLIINYSVTFIASICRFSRTISNATTEGERELVLTLSCFLNWFEYDKCDLLNTYIFYSFNWSLYKPRVLWNIKSISIRFLIFISLLRTNPDFVAQTTTIAKAMIEMQIE